MQDPQAPSTPHAHPPPHASSPPPPAAHFVWHRLSALRPRHYPMALGIVSILFLLHAFFLCQSQGFGVVDDAYISFRYVDQVLAGNGWVFNVGERVEGYSNFLWILALIPFRALGFPLVESAQLLGCLCGLAVLLHTARLTERFTGAAWLGVGSALLLSLDGSFVRWCVEGLETPLFTLFFILAIHAELDIRQQSRGGGWLSLPGILLGLATLTRPDGIVLLAAFVAYRIFTGVRAFIGIGTVPGPVGRTLEDRARSIEDPLYWKEFISLFLSFGLLVIPHLLWRQTYYGEWLPNTAYIKVIPGFVSVVRGLRYVVMFFLHRWPLLLLLVLLAGYARWQKRLEAQAGQPTRVESTCWPLRFPALLCAVVVLYVCSVGGDWMGWGRFMVPILPLLSLLWVERVAHAFPQIALPTGHQRQAGSYVGRGYPRSMPAMITIVVASIATGITSSWLEERVRLQKAHREHLERQQLVRWLQQNAPPTAVLLTEEIGEIPYLTGLKTLDVYGLIDKHIARFGEYDPDSAPGHQRADLNYSLSLAPDFLVMADFQATFERNTRGAPATARYPALALYEPVVLDLPEGRLQLYRRRPMP